MIRDKDKEYAEPKSPDTVLAPTELVKNKYVVSAGGRNVKTFNPGPKKIMITNSNGDADAFSYNQADRFIGVNATGKLELVPRVPEVPPSGRELILDTSIGTAAFISLILEPLFWYEVEVIGAGGGGGGGVGRWNNLPNALDGQPGGAGAYIKTTFKLLVATEAIFRLGQGGSGGGAVVWYYGNPTPSWTGNNKGGNGGRVVVMPVESPAEANDGLNPVYMFNGTLTPTNRAGGAGINGGAKGGDTNITLGNIGTGGDPSDAQGIGGSGGGANGAYGGDGGNSDYRDNVDVLAAYTGGAGGAGGGIAIGGDGGGTSPSKPVSFGGGAGGSGVLVGAADYSKSSGGGGGGGATVFQYGEHFIFCGGGGGGAGAGYGGTNHSTPGQPGICNIEGYTEADNGGHAGEGCNFFNLVTSKSCYGGMGGKGIIRLWRCV